MEKELAFFEIFHRERRKRGSKFHLQPERKRKCRTNEPLGKVKRRPVFPLPGGEKRGGGGRGATSILKGDSRPALKGDILGG